MSRSSPVLDWKRNYEKEKKRRNKTKCAKNIFNRNDTKLLKSGSATGWNYTELMRQWKFIYEQISPVNDLSAKRGSCKRLRVEGSLVMFNATSKFLNSWRRILPSFPQISKILLWVEMISEIQWKDMRKKNALCHNPEECSYHIKLPTKKWNYHHSQFIKLLESGSWMYKNSSIQSVCSQELFQ